MSNLCASFFFDDRLLSLLPQINYVNLLEVRLDNLSPQKLASFSSNPILSKTSIPVLLTLRSKNEGGYFEGSSSFLYDFYKNALKEGVRYVDVEYQNYIKASKEEKHKIPFENLVLSMHLGESTEEKLLELFKQIVLEKAAVYKLIFTADSRGACAKKAIKVLSLAKEMKVSAICHAMGDYGTSSRILGAIYGNAWTYVSISSPKDKLTAKGMISLNDMQTVYNLKNKTTSTKLLGLLGDPVVHSQGIYYHNKKFLENKRNSLYINFPSKDAFHFWHTLKENISGLSITIPHKKKMAELVDKKEASAQALGVCNTVIKENGQWVGYNTDVQALISCLSPHTKENQSWLIIGTGATAESSIYALKKLGIESIYSLGRNSVAGARLNEKYNVPFFSSEQDVPDILDGIVQTTPVGMYPNINECPKGASLLKKDMIVMDVIYNPEKTTFLNLAEKKGCRTISGRIMFELQAKFQSDRFLKV